MPARTRPPTRPRSGVDYRLTVVRLDVDRAASDQTHGAPAAAAAPVTERAVRDRLTAREARAAVRKALEQLRIGATIDAQTRDNTAAPWQPVSRHETTGLWRMPYDAWPSCITFRVRRDEHRADGQRSCVETRITLEPAPAEATSWAPF